MYRGLWMINTVTSGQATLDCDKTLQAYIQQNLIKINNYEEHCELIFKDEIQHRETFKTIPGFMEFTETSVSYHFNLGIIKNQDIGAIIKEVDSCVQTENKNIVPIKDTYYKLVNNILSVGDIHSTFIELILSILYVGYDNEIIRYQLGRGVPIEITKKYSIKEAHNFISPILSLLYQPNVHSIKKYYDSLIESNSYYVSIYEKIWMDLM